MNNIDLKIGRKNIYLFFYKITGDVIIPGEENNYYGAVVKYSTIINRGKGVQVICIPKKTLEDNILNSFTLVRVEEEEKAIFGAVDYCPENGSFTLRTTIGCVRRAE